MVKIDGREITDIELDGIDHRDYPDYCDAIIDRLNRQHRAQMREMTARGVLYGLVFGAVMLALGISVGSAGLYAVLSEVMK